MQKLVWQNSNGDEINLTSGNYGITNWEGFSNTSLNIQSQQVPFQDGGVFLDALLEQRELSVTLAIYDGNNLETRYRLRRELVHALNPKLGEGYLIYTNNFISKRIKCVAQIPLFETHNSDMAGTPKASLSWTASEPYWEDLEETVVELTAGEMKEIENTGDVKSQIKVEIKGNLLNGSIVKLDTKQRIKINDYVNEPLVINTNIGSKSIYKKSISYELEYTSESGDSFATNGDILISVCTWYGFIINTYNERKSLPFYNNMIRSITYGNGQFVICAGDRYYTSANGESWSEGTLLPTGINYNYKNVIIYKNGLFFLFIRRYSQFEIYKSVDLTNLELLYTEEWNNQKEIDVVYGNNIYLIKYNIGSKGELLKYQQTIEKTITENPYPFKKIAYGNGLFVFTNGTDNLQTTTDGETLVDISVDTSDYNVIFYNGKFVKTGMDYLSKKHLYSSVDCINWEEKTEIPINVDDLIVYNNCIYLFGTQEYLAVTTNLENLFVIYNSVYNNVNNNSEITNILFINEKFWGAMTTDLKSSEDGVLFKTKQITPDISPFSIQNGNGVIVLVSKSKIAVFNEIELNNTSINCRIVMENLSGINGIKYYNGKFIVYGTNILLVSNDNGEHWSSINVPNGNYNSVAYGNGYYIIAGGSNFILRTVDFTNIETIETPFLNSVCFGSGMFLAVTYITNRYIFVKSQSGTNWTEVQTDFIMKGGYSHMIYENGYFIGIIGDKFITSNDGTYFSAQPNTVYLKCEGIGYGNESFIILQNRVISKTYYNKDTNLIDKLSADSDMSLGLDVGNNIIKFAYDEGSANAILSYRQKYIGV